MSVKSDYKSASIWHRLAWHYHEQCEAFDREICTQRTPGGIAKPRPGTPEGRMVNSHARRLLDRMSQQAYFDGHADSAGAARAMLKMAIALSAKDFEQACVNDNGRSLFVDDN